MIGQVGSLTPGWLVFLVALWVVVMVVVPFAVHEDRRHRGGRHRVP